jgi:hypothetical protein
MARKGSFFAVSKLHFQPALPPPHDLTQVQRDQRDHDDDNVAEQFERSWQCHALTRNNSNINNTNPRQTAA